MITVCLGFRRWHHTHLKYCLASLQALDLPVVVALTDETYDAKADDIAISAGAMTIIDSQSEWSRSRALNLAAQAVRTSHVCFTDADMLFPPSWRRRAEAVLYESPRTLWLTRSRDLDALATDCVQSYTCSEDTLYLLSRVHPDVGQGAGMLVNVEWFRAVGGFDEAYSVWGAEDNDLVLRAGWDNVAVDWLHGTFVAHQFHRRDWPTTEQYEQVKRNREYLDARRQQGGPIIRNQRETA